MLTRLTQSEYKKALINKFGTDSMFVGKFPKNCDEKTPLSHKCIQCGSIYENTIQAQLTRSKSTCLRCFYFDKSANTNDKFFEFASKLKKKFDYIECVEFKSIKTKAKFKCECGNEWQTQPSKILKEKIGCPKCAKTNKLVKLKSDNKEHSYIDQGLCFLTKKGVERSKIKLYSDKKAPEIRYIYQKIQRTYTPDFLLSDTLIDVSSVEMFLNDFEKNKAKTKACLRSGYKHRFLICDNGKTFSLPLTWIKQSKKELSSYISSKSLKSLRILSIDPGSKNFAWSVLTVTRPMSVKLEATGMLQSTIQNLTDPIQQTDDFVKEIECIVNSFHIDHIILERFMYRMGIKGITMELVNVMIGVLLSKYTNDRFKLITASQWKNEWNRYSDLKAFYEKAPCTVHQVDSIGIGIYGASIWLNEKPFINIVEIEKKLPVQIRKNNYSAIK